MLVTVGMIASLPSVNKADSATRKSTNLVRCEFVNIRPGYDKCNARMEYIRGVQMMGMEGWKERNEEKLNACVLVATGCPAIRISAAGMRISGAGSEKGFVRAWIARPE